MMKTAKIIGSFLLVILLTACSQSALGERAIVRAMYLNKMDDSYVAKLLVVKVEPSAEAGSWKEEIMCIDGSGDNLMEALRKAENKENGQAFYGQNEVLLLGPELAENELFKTCRFLEKETRGRPNTAVYQFACDPDIWSGSELSDLLQDIQQIGESSYFKSNLYELSSSNSGVLPGLSFENQHTDKTGLAFYFDNVKQGQWIGEQADLAALLKGQNQDVPLIFQLENSDVKFNISSPKICYEVKGKEDSLQLNITIYGRITGFVSDSNDILSAQIINEINWKIEQVLLSIVQDSFEKRNDIFQFTSWLQNENAAQVQQLQRNGTFWDSKRITLQSRLQA